MPHQPRPGQQPSSPWSELAGHLDGFLADESDSAVGSWAIGQGPDSPDRLLFRHLLTLVLSDETDRLSLLEVGCGAGVEVDGLLTDGLLPRLDYHGIDLTPELVAICRSKHPSLSFSVGNIFELESPNVSDVVVCRHVLEHLDDGTAALRKLWDMSRQTLVVSWFRRPAWNPAEVSLGWEEVEVDERSIAFMHQRYDHRALVRFVRDQLKPIGLYRFDFDHHTHPCSVWVISRAGLRRRHLEALHEFLLTERFLSAVDDPPPGMSTAEVIADLRGWASKLETARDWWHEQASSFERELQKARGIAGRADGASPGEE